MASADLYDDLKASDNYDAWVGLMVELVERLGTIGRPAARRWLWKPD